MKSIMYLYPIYFRCIQIFRRQFVPLKAISYSNGNLKLTREEQELDASVQWIGWREPDDRPAALLWGCALIPGYPWHAFNIRLTSGFSAGAMTCANIHRTRSRECCYAYLYLSRMYYDTLVTSLNDFESQEIWVMYMLCLGTTFSGIDEHTAEPCLVLFSEREAQRKAALMVTFMWQLNWDMGCPDVWLNITLGMSCEGISGWD